MICVELFWENAIIYLDFTSFFNSNTMLVPSTHWGLRTHVSANAPGHSELMWCKFDDPDVLLQIIGSVNGLSAQRQAINLSNSVFMSVGSPALNFKSNLNQNLSFKEMQLKMFVKVSIFCSRAKRLILWYTPYWYHGCWWPGNTRGSFY